MLFDIGSGLKPVWEWSIIYNALVKIFIIKIWIKCELKLIALKIIRAIGLVKNL
ncbi:hypothetical protein HK096_000907, partial [Nowakowskiella sp. JEL0078]